jgi:hypothetical protein
MVNILGLIVLTVVITGIGVALALLAYKLTRPKKQTWNARVYTLSTGIHPKIRDKDGNIISKVRLRDLKPYMSDVIEKRDEKGITLYKLVKLNRVVPEVTSDAVDYWGKDAKEVSVLLDGETTTILKKGYDHSTGKLIFDPMPVDRINMIMGNMAVRKARLKQEKDVLQAITPWVIAGIGMMAIFAVAYITISGLIEINEDQTMAAQEISVRLGKLGEVLDRLGGQVCGYDHGQGVIEPTVPPPPVE